MKKKISVGVAGAPSVVAATAGGVAATEAQILHDVQSCSDDLEDKINLLIRHANFPRLHPTSPASHALRQIHRTVQRQYKELNDLARRTNPLSTFKPSFEQTLMLNSWVWGISFNMVFTANRMGKTAAAIINALLWIIPNDPNWIMFKPYTDHKGRLCQVLTRPDIFSLETIQNAPFQTPPDPMQSHLSPHNAPLLDDLRTNPATLLALESTYPLAPWNESGNIWFGAPDFGHHKAIIFPEWKKWIPAASLKRYILHDAQITIETPSGSTFRKWEIQGKSYDSKETKWASGAVDMILLTEGVPPQAWPEIKLRFKYPGIGSWDFTPYEAANAGPSTHLAYRIYKGLEPVPLRHFVFSGFSIRDVPSHITPESKKNDIIKSFEGTDEGKARVDGCFFTSSNLVLSNLDRSLHLLDWTTEELFTRYPHARRFRAVDPGWDHPTSCAWAALLPGNIWIFYRFLSERNLTIDERCSTIISMSGNAREKIANRANGVITYREVHPYPNSEVYVATVCDYHMFKADETTGLPYSIHYLQGGLPVIESIHMGPRDRAELLNSRLKPSLFIPSLTGGVPPAPQVYFLQKEQGVMAAFLKWEEYYRESYTTGPMKGQPKDTLPSHGDDELDVATYLVASPFRWTASEPKRIYPRDLDDEFNLAQFAKSPIQPTFQKPKGYRGGEEVVYFGNKTLDND